MDVAEYLSLQRHAVPAPLERVREDRVARHEHGLEVGALAAGVSAQPVRLLDCERRSIRLRWQVECQDAAGAAGTWPRPPVFCA